MARKKRVRIVQVIDPDECFNPKTGEPVPVWVYNDDGWYKKEKIVKNDASEATLQELCDLCDQEAESANMHDFVGVHRGLAEILLEHINPDEAADIMRAIAYRHGLPELR